MSRSRNFVVQNMMSNPDFMRSIMENNPQMRQVMETNPELRNALEDPEFMRRSMEMMRDPSAMQNMMRKSRLLVLINNIIALSSYMHPAQSPNFISLALL